MRVTVCCLSAVLVAMTVFGTSAAPAFAKHHKRHASVSGRAKNIVQTARAAGSFTKLVTAINAAGLTRTLEGRGPFTVFAPDDAAFAKLPKGQLDALLNDKTKLRTVLKYHVVGQKLMAADVSQKRSVPTLEGQSLMINAKDGTVIIDGALVTKPDIACGNGVIHVIDTVLMPERGK